MISDTGDTKPRVIQGLVNQTRVISAAGSSGSVSGSSTLWLPGFASGGSPRWDSQTQAPRFWVLNRASPAQQPVSFVAANSSTVPPGLAQLMDNQHILVAAVLAYTYLVPQGPLYQLLSDNGAGTALAAVENLNTGMACGVMSMFSYVLVSVPGAGEELGIEFLDLPAPLTDFFGTGTGAGAWAKGVSLAPFDLVLDDENGLYYLRPRSFRCPPASRHDRRARLPGTAADHRDQRQHRWHRAHPGHADGAGPADPRLRRRLSRDRLLRAGGGGRRSAFAPGEPGGAATSSPPSRRWR